MINYQEIFCKIRYEIQKKACMYIITKRLFNLPGGSGFEVVVIEAVVVIIDVGVVVMVTIEVIVVTVVVTAVDVVSSGLVFPGVGV